MKKSGRSPPYINRDEDTQPEYSIILVSVDFLRQQRTRFLLNNRILQAIEEAIRQDEIEPTNTQYDWFNAISRVATHDELLNFRQRRTLSRMAGEFSQYTAHQCRQCGSWIMAQN